MALILVHDLLQILELAQKNNKFKAVDKAIGKNGFKVVTLLRLSPLLPLALSNYFYGLTSVDLPSYIAGSWLGMLPGTVLYVIAGERFPGQGVGHYNPESAITLKASHSNAKSRVSPVYTASYQRKYALMLLLSGDSDSC